MKAKEERESESEDRASQPASQAQLFPAATKRRNERRLLRTVITDRERERQREREREREREG